jgi:hypothetical protein
VAVTVENGVATATFDHDQSARHGDDQDLDASVASWPRTMRSASCVRSASPNSSPGRRGVDPDAPPTASKPTTLGLFHQIVDRFRTMPKATIVSGRARGGGEFLLSLDMRFSPRTAVLARPR